MAGRKTKMKRLAMEVWDEASEVWEKVERAGGLTDIEEGILDGLAAGKTRQEICHEQGIGHTAYDTYLLGVRRYLRVRTTIEAVAVYLKEKMKNEEE